MNRDYTLLFFFDLEVFDCAAVDFFAELAFPIPEE
jgi:hypothetical protein